MASPAPLEVRALSKRFGTVDAVRELSLRVEPGEIFGFLGPNGAGKTTTLRMMTGLLRPTSGSVHVFGDDLAQAPEVVRDRVGVCPQENVLWPDLTCEETLLLLADLHGLPRRLRRERANELLRGLGLSEKRRARVRTLSGGMKRRLTLATALVHDPELLLLDEPEAGLDPQARLVVREYIQSLRSKKTVLLTTHNMDEAERLADRVGIIDHGRLIALGPKARLKQTHGRGDVLEVRLSGDPKPVAARLQRARLGDVSVLERTVLVRGLDLARRLPLILDHVRAAGSAVDDVRYRENTLEDVFIALTGRGLRE